MSYLSHLLAMRTQSLIYVSSRRLWINNILKGSIIINGGTVNVRRTPVRANEIVFGDDVRVGGVTADKRADRCREGDSFTVEKCPHDNLAYTDVDEISHSKKCRDCMISVEDTEAHSYGEPAWNWDENGTAASADFTCVKCGHKQTRQAEQQMVEPEAAESEAGKPEAEDQPQKEKGARKSKVLREGSDAEEELAVVDFEGKIYTDERGRTEYAIELEKCENGSVEVAESAAVGDTVTVLVTPDKHYHIVSVSVNGEALTVRDGTCSFIMPKGNVKISAEFEADTVQLKWVSRDYVYDYEKDEYTDELVDTVVYTEEVPYGTESPLPGAEEFAAMYGYIYTERSEEFQGSDGCKSSGECQHYH